MRAPGARWLEWLVAMLVLATSALGAMQVRRESRELDEVSQRRREQLERLGGMTQTANIPESLGGTLQGLFAEHDVVVDRAVWGCHLGLRERHGVRCP